MIEVGNNSVNEMFVGAAQVARIYLGSQLVYDNAPQSPESFAARQKSTVPSSPYGFYEYLPEGYNNQSEVPLVIFLHGADERGDGNGQLGKVLTWGIPKLCSAGTWHHNFIMLAPQWLGTNDDGYYAASDLFDFIEFAKQNYKVDPTRIYITGLSAGNWITFYYLANYPSTHGIAAFAGLSGLLENGYTDANIVAPSAVPMWFLSNIGDPSVSWDNPSAGIYGYSVLSSRDALNAITPGMVEKVTGFNNSTHTGTWDGIYDGSLMGSANSGYDPFDESIYDWMMQHQV